MEAKRGSLGTSSRPGSGVYTTLGLLSSVVSYLNTVDLFVAETNTHDKAFVMVGFSSEVML